MSVVAVAVRTSLDLANARFEGGSISAPLSEVAQRQSSAEQRIARRCG